MGKNKTLKTVLVFVQDETGSMLDIQDQTVSAFNEYFETLKNTNDIGDVEAVIWQFSDTFGQEPKVRPFYKGALAKVPKLTFEEYRPRGNTPLLDAVGTSLQQAEAIAADRYLFIVQTDGLENASKDFSREQVAKLVAAKEASTNWTIVFLGAGIDNWMREAQAYGVAASSAVPFVAKDVAFAYAAVGRASGQFLRSASIKGSVASAALADMENEGTDDGLLEAMKDQLTKPVQ